MSTHRDVRTCGEDGHGAGFGVIEGCDGKMGSPAQPPLAAWHVRVRNIHHHPAVPQLILDERFLVLRLEPIPVLVPQYLRISDGSNG